MTRFRLFGFCLIFALSALVASASTAFARTIALFYALESDRKTLEEKSHVIGDPIRIGGHVVEHLKIGGDDLYAMKMGSGPVETAISATLLLTKFRCDMAFSIGPAGALRNDLQIGSWYEVASVICYQKGSWNKSTFQINDAMKLGHADDLPVDVGVKFPVLFEHTAKIVVASGEIFVASTTYRDQLCTTTGADAVEMNLFGLQLACHDQHVPLRSWRIISDHADDLAGDAFKKFVSAYQGEAGAALAELIARLPPDANSPSSYPELTHRLSEPHND